MSQANVNYNIADIKPKFEAVTISESKSTVFIKMAIPPDSMQYEYQYSIEISTAVDAAIKSDSVFYRNWESTDEEIQKYLFYANESKYWGSFFNIFEGPKRVFKYERIFSNNVYRFRFRYKVKDRNGVIYYSQFSDIKMVYAKRTNPDSYQVNLYVKGTGRNNHDNVIVRLGKNELLKHGSFMGLYLIILDRNNLAVEHMKEYNTFLKGPKRTITTPVIDYSVNEEGVVSAVTNEKQVTILNDYQYANELYEKLRSLNETKMIILVSCYGWEKYVTSELLDLLGSYGALYIREFKNINEEDYKDPFFNSWKNQELIKKRPYYHPLAFVGVPNMTSGLGYESIRHNKANFIDTKNIPQAELLVRLRWYTYHKNYFFDDDILGKHKLTYSDSYDLTFKSKDFSLLNLIPLLHYSNHTLGFNLGFNIFNDNIKVDVKQTKPIDEEGNPYQTQYDKVTLGDKVGADRYSYLGVNYQVGKDLREQDYYDFYYSIVHEEKLCTPPYENSIVKKECPKSSFNKTIPILACQTGIAPHVCDSNVNNKTNIFSGYS